MIKVQIRSLVLKATTAALLAAPAHALDRDMSAFYKWREVVARESVTPSKERSVQDILNSWKQVPYVPEDGDYWQTRAETRQNGGDCEDFAIALYYDMVETGHDEDKLLIVISQVRTTEQLHAYLRYGATIIDRREKFRELTKQQERRIYFPLYGVNRRGWVNLLPNQGV